MSERSTEQIRELLDSLYRVDSGRILATLIRSLGDFDLAEEAMRSLAAAVSLWPRSGVSGNPRPCGTRPIQEIDREWKCGPPAGRRI